MTLINLCRKKQDLFGTYKKRERERERERDENRGIKFQKKSMCVYKNLYRIYFLSYIRLSWSDFTLVFY